MSLLKAARLAQKESDYSLSTRGKHATRSPWHQGGPECPAPLPPTFVWEFFLKYFSTTCSKWNPGICILNALDCISENFNLKNLPGGACAQNSLEKCMFAVLMGAIAPILPLHTISLGLIYHKILCPPLGMAADKCINQLSLLFFITDTVDKKYLGTSSTLTLSLDVDVERM